MQRVRHVLNRKQLRFCFLHSTLDHAVELVIHELVMQRSLHIRVEIVAFAIVTESGRGPGAVAA
jgi:hypothetical protein